MIFWNDYFGGVQTEKRKTYTGRKMEPCKYLMPIVIFLHPQQSY